MHHHISGTAKERCKYYPACGKGDSCEFAHPVTTCKQFPNCKYGDQCMYYHPRCRFDLTCNKLNCNFSHTLSATGTAPPLCEYLCWVGLCVLKMTILIDFYIARMFVRTASHVVPVNNYKSISNATLPALCRFHPKCTNTLCTFYHPKPCRFGRNCGNRLDCSFWHPDGGPSSTLPLSSSSSLSSSTATGSSGGSGGKDKLKWFASSTVY